MVVAMNALVVKLERVRVESMGVYGHGHGYALRHRQTELTAPLPLLVDFLDAIHDMEAWQEEGFVERWWR